MHVISAVETRFGDLARALAGPVSVEFTPAAWRRVDAAAEAVSAVVRQDGLVYGVNTGFGALATTAIPSTQLEELQENLVRSHATGVGEDLDIGVVRLIMVLKVLSFSRGHSGVGRKTVEALQALLQNDIYPRIPAQGSVGASGDLAPLAHMSLVLMGEGEAHYKGEIIGGARAAEVAGFQPIKFGPKEGLALINGTQVSTALALKAYLNMEEVFAAAVISGALSVDAAAGSDVPFDTRVQMVRGQVGQGEVAAVYRNLLAGSEIRENHVDCGRVQDPYSLRCQPQVMGAILDFMRPVADILWREALAVTDNPIVFPATGDIISGGNFHAEPVALAADNLAIGITELGNMSERRIALLMDSSLSGLPPFLASASGVESGLMIAHVTAAALASENKQQSHPASVDTIPTSANQEDHVSMATHGARRLIRMVDNAARIVAIEILAAVRGIELRAPLKTSAGLQQVMANVRALVPRNDKDHALGAEIMALGEHILAGRLRGNFALNLPSETVDDD